VAELQDRLASRDFANQRLTGLDTGGTNPNGEINEHLYLFRAFCIIDIGCSSEDFVQTLRSEITSLQQQIENHNRTLSQLQSQQPQATQYNPLVDYNPNSWQSVFATLREALHHLADQVMQVRKVLEEVLESMKHVSLICTNTSEMHNLMMVGSISPCLTAPEMPSYYSRKIRLFDNSSLRQRLMYRHGIRLHCQGSLASIWYLRPWMILWHRCLAVCRHLCVHHQRLLHKATMPTLECLAPPPTRYLHLLRTLVVTTENRSLTELRGYCRAYHLARVRMHLQLVTPAVDTSTLLDITELAPRQSTHHSTIAMLGERLLLRRQSFPCKQ